MKSNGKKLKRDKVIPVIPNLFTTANLFFGLLSVMTSIEIAAALHSQPLNSDWVYRKFWWAAAFVVISAFFDKLDGTLARILRSESPFGLSYDSLCDLVSFGVAPGVLVYVWALMDSGKLGLMAVLFYIVCSALRLARFNVQSGDVEKYTFAGIPSPVAAGLMISPILLFSGLGISSDWRILWFYLAAAPVIGLLMVSDIPYWKYPKKFKLTSPFNALVVASIIIAAVITNPEIIFILAVYTYTITGILLYTIKYLRKDESFADEIESDEINP